MASDVENRLMQVAREEIERLPYSLDADAAEELRSHVEHGATQMHDQGRMSPEDMTEAETNLRRLLHEAQAHVVLRTSGEHTLVSGGLSSIVARGGWWPF